MSPHHPSTTDQPDPAASGSDELARTAAVDEAHAVFDDHWPRWARAHDRPLQPAPSCEDPRVTLVGETPAEFHYLAVLRFAFEVDGRRFAGIARGPRAAPTFRIWLLADPDPGGGPGWWRRLRGGDRTARHRPSTVVP